MNIKDFPKGDQDFVRTAEDAIKSGQCVHLVYHGEPRLCEVHAIGVSRKGKPCVRVYQVLGGAVFSDTVGWKMLSLEDIESFQLSDMKANSPREGYVPGDKGMQLVYKELPNAKSKDNS